MANCLLDTEDSMICPYCGEKLRLIKQIDKGEISQYIFKCDQCGKTTEVVVGMK